jgi:hypothetical protein
MSGTAVRLWNVFPNIQEYVVRAKASAPRGLVVVQRESLSLSPEPPLWYIEMEKWPYHTQDWKDWLRFNRANANPPLPGAR